MPTDNTVTLDPMPTTTDMYRATDPTIPPKPPSPKAEPFHPATTVPAAATAPTPREHAYTLHLQGYRSPAIAAHLHVPERTIRSWIQQTNQDLNALPLLDTLDALTDADQPDPQAGEAPDPTQPTPAMSLTTLQAQRTLAVERHRARAAAAWALHDQLRATLDPFLARLSERLLLHTQYPDDNDNVSMATLALAGGPLSPAFRAMYQMLPGLITGLTRSLALAERADLQIDRLQVILPPTTQPSAPTPPATHHTPSAAPMQPLPTREEINRAVQVERDADDDAYIASLTERQRYLLRLYASMPAKLPDGPVDTWDIKIDPNVNIRGLHFPLPHIHHGDDDDNGPDPTPTASTPPARRPTGTPTGNPGNASGNPSGNPSGNAPGTPGNNIGKHSGNASGKHVGKPSGTLPGNTAGTPPAGNHRPKIGNPGNKSGNPTGNDSHSQHPAASSPRATMKT